MAVITLKLDEAYLAKIGASSASEFSVAIDRLLDSTTAAKTTAEESAKRDADTREQLAALKANIEASIKAMGDQITALTGQVNDATTMAENRAAHIVSEALAKTGTTAVSSTVSTNVVALAKPNFAELVAKNRAQGMSAGQAVRTAILQDPEAHRAYLRGGNSTQPLI